MIAAGFAMKARLSTPQRRKIADKYAAGFSVSELAREYGVDRHTVTRQLDQAGPAPKPTSLTPAEVATFRALIASVERSNSPKCGAVMVRPRVVVAGECPRCGTGWACGRVNLAVRG
jgi:transposase-like protein